MTTRITVNLVKKKPISFTIDSYKTTENNEYEFLDKKTNSIKRFPRELCEITIF